MMQRFGVFCGFVAVFAIAGCSGGSSDAPATGAPSFGAAELEADIRYLSDDALGGRGPATEGDRLARRYIAEQLGISTRQLERLFGKYLNASPKKYFMEMRLERARHLLIQTEASVTDVAFACGFESAGHFSRVYRAAFGVTPMLQRGRLD